MNKSYKNKKIFLLKNMRIVALIICLIFSIASVNSYANDEEDDEEKLVNEIIAKEIEEENVVSTANNPNQKLMLNSRRYAIYDRNSGLVVYGKNENKQTAQASTTKIMTCLVVLEKCKDLNEVVTVCDEAARTGGSVLDLKKDDKITVQDLLYGLMLRSGNDAAIQLAIHIGGSVTGFANLMNEKSKEIGLKNTNFVTPHGLDDPNHYTTAEELAKLTDYALKNEKFSQIVKTTYKTITINGNSREIKNTNELLIAGTEGVYGVKTGFTNNAGRCLVTSVKRKNMDLIIVVLGADTRKDRAKDTLKLIDYACKQFRTENVEEIINDNFKNWNEINSKRIYINKGRKDIELELAEIKIKTIVTNKDINVEINSLNYLEATVTKGQKIGTVIVRNGDEIIEEIDIITKNSVERRNVLDYFCMFAKMVS